MATATGQVVSWNSGRKTAWASQGWVGLGTKQPWNGQYSAIGGTYNHRVCFEIKTPSFTGTATSVHFTWYGKKVSSTSGTTYAAIQPSFKTYNDSTGSHSDGAVGVGSMSYNSTTTAKREIDIPITGTLKPNTTYYLYLYTNSTGVVYRAEPGASYYSLTVTYDAPKQYTITFDANGGSVSPTSVTHTNGGSTTLPTPTRTGYTFWYWADMPNIYSTEYYSPFTGTLYSDITMYAHWQVNTYYVKYDGNGHTSGSMSNSTHTYGSSSALTSNAYSRTGYNFLGWSTSSSATSATYSDGQYVSNLTATNGATVTLYAVWKAKTYTVSYNANGYGTAPSSQTKTHGTDLKLQSFIGNQSVTGYKVSYNANGGSSTPTAQTSTITKKQTYWNTNSSGTGTNYGSGGTYSKNAAATMYAIWGSSTNNAITLASAISKNSSTSSYTISYNVNGGNSTKPNNQTLTRTTPYSFSKWAAGSTSGTQYSAGASFTPSAATTMYAIWTTGTTTGSITLAGAATKNNTTASGYKVSFNANGGSCATSSLTATDTIKWSFAGWNTNSNGTGTNYSAGGSYSTSANATLYAKWTSSVATRGSITLPTATRDGYNFKGWSTSSSATSGSTGSYTPSSSHTLYAVWELKTYTISYNANGHGTAPTAQTKKHGVALGLRSFISQQTATGYKVSFNANNGSSTPSALTSTIYYDQTYWNTNSSGTGTNYGSGASYTSNASTTLYAIWKTSNGSVTLPSAITRSSIQENGYTVTFNANGGTCSTTSLQAKNTRKYTFNKWAAGSTSGTKYSAGASFTPSAATTMYATWTESVTNGSITLPTPTRTGYTFMGWATSSTATSGSTGTYTPSGNVTLYATWKANGAVQIGTGTGHQMALVYIHNGTEYVLAIPYVHDGTEWKMAIGG